MVVGLKGRSLGMYSAGLRPVDTAGRPLTRRHVAFSLAALGAALRWLDWWRIKRGDQSGSYSDLRGDERQRRHEELRQQMLQRRTSPVVHPAAETEDPSGIGTDRCPSRIWSNVVIIQNLLHRNTEKAIKVGGIRSRSVNEG